VKREGCLDISQSVREASEVGAWVSISALPPTTSNLSWESFIGRCHSHQDWLGESWRYSGTSMGGAKNGGVSDLGIQNYCRISGAKVVKELVRELGVHHAVDNRSSHSQEAYIAYC
jgi:hypothetical protein